MRTKTLKLSNMSAPPAAEPTRPKLPTFSADLIRELDAQHPRRCIGLGESEIQAHRYAAVREFIEGLLQRIEGHNPMDDITHVPR